MVVLRRVNCCFDHLPFDWVLEIAALLTHGDFSSPNAWTFWSRSNLDRRKLKQKLKLRTKKEEQWIYFDDLCSTLKQKCQIFFDLLSPAHVHGFAVVNWDVGLLNKMPLFVLLLCATNRLENAEHETQGTDLMPCDPEHRIHPITVQYVLNNWLHGPESILWIS
jgi:hypothetical protein